MPVFAKEQNAEAWAEATALAATAGDAAPKQKIRQPTS